MSELLEKAKECFQANANHKEYYVTKDGQCFTKEDSAVDHARSLKEKEITLVTRAQAEGPTRAEIKAADKAAKEANEQKIADKAEVEAKAKAEAKAADKAAKGADEKVESAKKEVK
jgi:hypothetical protein